MQVPYEVQEFSSAITGFSHLTLSYFEATALRLYGEVSEGVALTLGHAVAVRVTLGVDCPSEGL